MSNLGIGSVKMFAKKAVDKFMYFFQRKTSKLPEVEEKENLIGVHPQNGHQTIQRPKKIIIKKAPPLETV